MRSTSYVISHADGRVELISVPKDAEDARRAMGRKLAEVLLNGGAVTSFTLGTPPAFLNSHIKWLSHSMQLDQQETYHGPG